MEHWETYRDITGRVFTVKALSDDSLNFHFNPDSVIIENIKTFEKQLNTWKKLIYKDKSSFTGYKIFIDTMQEDEYFDDFGEWTYQDEYDAKAEKYFYCIEQMNNTVNPKFEEF